MKASVAAVFAITMVLRVQAADLSCGKGEVCPEGHCCMVGGGRYDLPICTLKGVSGDSCRPNNQPEDLWLTAYPGDEGSLYTGVYRNVCPCLNGLQCADGTCTY
ncbi:astakine-like [Schistocerca piceifrons]|uniref:astakine-like n=1 Tax=Schistocerca piceifrons TaxID=274613 RepID=UPI001F5F1EF1|nr:astakine-like [Schistocerca piceifrons]